MAEQKLPSRSEMTFEIPQSLKTVLGKLPSPEAIQVIEDIGKVAWVVDNNNNNNTGHTVLEEQVLTQLSKIPPDRLAEVLKSTK